MSFKVAVATSDGINIDLGFGKTDRFLILDVNDEGAYVEEGYRLSPKGLNNLTKDEGASCSKSLCSSCSHGCEGGFNVEFLWDVTFVLATEFSHKVSKLLNRIFIDNLAVSLPIKDAIPKLAAFENRRNRKNKEATKSENPSAKTKALKEVVEDRVSTSSHLFNRVAVASSDGHVINEHFGHARQFHIFDLKDNVAVYVGKRDVTPACNGGGHLESSFKKISKTLDDCSAIVVAKIGEGASSYLEHDGFLVFEAPFLITEVLQKIIEDRLLEDSHD
ncbi:MAG: NifB/NifX family molybdenum-iron cluster-binding protein [Succinivibrio sp.]